MLLDFGLQVCILLVMARKGRIEYCGAYYHVMARGDRGELIFKDDIDRKRFVDTLDGVCKRTGWWIHAYVLMNNHYHLMMETPKPNLVVGMKWLQGTYTIRFNHRHQWHGHLFQGRYKAVVVEPDGGNYFQVLADYIHLNPTRSGLVKADEKLQSYRWSSLPYYLGNPANRPDWLRVEAVLGAFGLADTLRGRRIYSGQIESRTRAELQDKAAGERYQFLRRGWYIGGREFRDELMERFDDQFTRQRKEMDAKLTRDHTIWRAEEIIRLGLQCFGLNEADIGSLAKNDPRKRLIGHLIKRETTVSLRWLGTRLNLGHDSRVSRYCGQIDDLNRDKNLSVMFQHLEDMLRSKD